MRLWASSLVNVSVHGRKRERRGEWEGDGKIEKKNKQHGKYSKAHAWVLTKCKWKGKSPHQHTATQGGSQDAFTLFSPPLSSPFHHLIAPPLPPPCIILNVSFFFPVVGSIEDLCEQLPYYHKRETVCQGPEVERPSAVRSPLLSGSSLFSRISLASVPSSIRSSLVITPMVLIPTGKPHADTHHNEYLRNETKTKC